VSKASAASRKSAPVTRLSSVSVDPFDKAGQLQRLAVQGSKPKLLIARQSALIYFPEVSSE
jgi:hypothetical protein